MIMNKDFAVPKIARFRRNLAIDKMTDFSKEKLAIINITALQSKKAIDKTTEFVKSRLENETTGHDWWHIERVYNLAVYIAKKEKAELFIVQLAALLHDIGDSKITGLEDNETKTAEDFLKTLNVDKNAISKVIDIIENMSFSKNIEKNQSLSVEGKIVQDADRLDALGAIGIARCFAYGSKKNSPIYDPKIKPTKFRTFQDYKNTRGSSINHFYEKLFLLKDKMNTKTGKKLAEKRHEFMRSFLKEFLKEWDLKDLK